MENIRRKIPVGIATDDPAAFFDNTHHLHCKREPLLVVVLCDVISDPLHTNMRENTAAISKVKCFILKGHMLPVGSEETGSRSVHGPCRCSLSVIDPDRPEARCAKLIDIRANAAA